MIHILGAGSMGCLWAAHLSHSNTVCFVSRKPATNSSKQFILHKPYKRDASCYQIPSLTIKEIIQETIHPTTDQDSLSSIDTLLVCTKSYDALSALTELKPKLTVHTNIILFQNGLGSQYDIINAFPDNPIFAAVSTEGANRKSETEIIHAGVGETKLGLLTTSKPNLLDACFQTLATSVVVTKCIGSFPWGRLGQHRTAPLSRNGGRICQLLGPLRQFYALCASDEQTFLQTSWPFVQFPCPLCKTRAEHF
jgi:2-dehydropantoate 2-reductase